MKSLNAYPRERGKIKLKEEHQKFIKPLLKKFSYSEYLEINGINEEKYLNEFVNNFNRLDLYRSRANYNNNLKTNRLI